MSSDYLNNLLGSPNRKMNSSEKYSSPMSPAFHHSSGNKSDGRNSNLNYRMENEKIELAKHMKFDGLLD